MSVSAMKSYHTRWVCVNLCLICGFVYRFNAESLVARTSSSVEQHVSGLSVGQYASGVWFISNIPKGYFSERYAHLQLLTGDARAQRLPPAHALADPMELIVDPFIIPCVLKRAGRTHSLTSTPRHYDCWGGAVCGMCMGRETC